MALGPHGTFPLPTTRSRCSAKATSSIASIPWSHRPDPLRNPQSVSSSATSPASPQNCLPGAGWTFDSQKYTEIQDINGKNYKVGEYVIGNGDVKQFVIYWYQAHGRSIPNEYVAKGYLVADAIRMNRTDGALVRVITQILPSESLETARARALRFTQQMAPNLPRFVPN